MSIDTTTPNAFVTEPGTERPGAAAAQPERLNELLHAIDQSSWIAAAASAALSESDSSESDSNESSGGESRSPAQRSAAAVLAAAGIDVGSAVPRADRAAVAAQAAAPVLQAAAYLRGVGLNWAEQPDEALMAQGRASARGASALVRFALPVLPGLTPALARPGARILDVGTGVAALAVAWAELLPTVTVVGIDVLPRALALAAEVVAASPAAARVMLRRQDISDLQEEAEYALAWLPAPFVPEQALLVGLDRIHRALAPGGWVIIGHGKFTGDPVADAVTRFKTIICGGTALDPDQARELLNENGFRDIATIPAPAGGPAVTVARTPS